MGASVRVETVPEAGHVLMFDRPDALVRAVAERPA